MTHDPRPVLTLYGVEAREALLRAIDLISDGGWTQEANARDHEGKDCGPHDMNARCFCIEGALFKVTGAHSSTDPVMARSIVAIDRALENSGYRKSIAEWNDHPGRTEADTIELLKSATVLV